MKRLVIRDFRPEDYEQFVLLADRAFGGSADSYWSVVGLKWAERTLVAELDGRIVGAIEIEVLNFREKGKHGHVGYIFVDPDFQRRGVGSALLKAAERWFIERGAICSWALTTRDNIAAQRFFLKHGYEVVTVEQIRKELGRRYAWKLLRRMVYWPGDVIFRKRLSGT